MSNLELEAQEATPISDLDNDDFTLEVIEDDTEDDNFETSDKDKEQTPEHNDSNIPDSTSTLLESETNDKYMNNKINNTSQQIDSKTDLTYVALESEPSLPDTNEVATVPSDASTSSRPKWRRDISHIWEHSYSYCDFKTCEFCGIRIRDALLEEHIVKEHVRKKKKPYLKVSRSIQTEKSIFHQCGECRFKSVNPEVIEKHRAGHDKWTMYMCDVCDFKDLSLLIVKRHRAEHNVKRESCVGSTR